MPTDVVQAGRRVRTGLERCAAVVVTVLLLPMNADTAPGQTVEELIGDLSAADRTRRAEAVKRLGEAGAAVAPRLAGIVADAGTDGLRAAALEALSRNAMAYAYSYVFWDALPADDSDPRARRLAWDCLIRVGDAFIAVGEVGAASDHYCDLLASADGARQRCEAIRGLGRASRRRAADEVFAALKDDDPMVRAAAVAAVADLRWGQARPRLERALDSAEPARLVVLLDALSRRTEADAADMVARFLDGEPAPVRAAARSARARQAGYVTDWCVLEPPDDVARREDGPAGAPGVPGQRPTVKVDGRTLWRGRLATCGADGMIHLRLAPGPTPPTGGYASADVVTTNARSVRLAVTGDVASFWLNGERIQLSGDGPAAGSPRRVVERQLNAGTNRLLVSARSGFSVRVADADGTPVILAPPDGESRE